MHGHDSVIVLGVVLPLCVLMCCAVLCCVSEDTRFLSYQLGKYKVLRWGALRRGLGIPIMPITDINIPVMKVQLHVMCHACGDVMS